MYKLLRLVLFIWSSLVFTLSAQNSEGFEFHRPNKKRYKIPFVNYNNLIIVKAELNGTPMNLLLDTGVDKTVLFGIEGNEEKIKKTSKKILIKGVSGKKKTYAYKNENNTLKIDKLVNYSQDIYVIFDKDFNISDKIGYQIQGIIGYDFFEQNIVYVNYIRNHLKVYNPANFSKSLRRYDTLALTLFSQKPYIKTSLKQKELFEDFIFLLDTGSGDAVWVKGQDQENLPEKSFYDILGYGFADIITGYRSKAKSLNLGSQTIKDLKIAYPDSLAYQGLSFINNSGVIGSEIMRRFHWYFDYSHRRVYVKPNSVVNEDFNYDMSGLILKYDGYQAIASYRNLFPEVKVQTDNRAGYNNVNKLEPKVNIEMRPILVVGAVRPNSSAFESGFVEGDEIIKINGKNAYRYDLEEITKMLCSKEGEVVNFKIKRNGSEYDKSIILKSRFLE